MSRTIKANKHDAGVVTTERIIVASRGRNPDNQSMRVAGMPTEQRLEAKKNGVTNTITTVQKDNMVMEERHRIRRLTPRECWRLMDFSDLDFFTAMLLDREKAAALMEKYKSDLNGIAIMREAKKHQRMSDSQLYKQAGNSIVRNVMIKIFRPLFE